MQLQTITQLEVDIQNYEVIKEIGGGGYSSVFKIQEKGTENFYAAKVLRESNQKYIDREIGILMCSNHPTIIKFIGYSRKDFYENDYITIILELAKNGSVFNLIQKLQDGQIPPNYNNTSRQIILIGIARGMKYLHDRGIFHRDLKSDNILLDENYFPYITDFGFSKFSEVGNPLDQTFFGGTLSNMAPEIFRGDPYDGKVDVYAFSIIMYEILSDSLSYPDLRSNKINQFSFQKKIVIDNYRPEFIKEVKPSLKSLIEKCWSKDPDERPIFKEIFEKLTNRYYFLDDVDLEKCQKYIEMITKVEDPIEHLLTKVEPIEDMNQQLTIDNKLLINSNIQLTVEYEEMRIENANLKKNLKETEQIKRINDQLTIENKQLKTDNKQITHENKHLKIENKQLSSSQLNLHADLNRLTKTNQQLQIQIRQLTNENKQLANENKKISAENLDLSSSCEKLSIENKQYSNDVKNLTIENKQLTASNKRLSCQNSKLTSDIERLTMNNEMMRRQIANLKKDMSKTPRKSLYSSVDSRFNSADNVMEVYPQNENDITLNEFNSCQLKPQQLFASKIKTSFLKKVNNFIQFLMQFDQLHISYCLEIDSSNKDKTLSMVSKEDKIRILSNVTELLYSKSLLNSKSFLHNIKAFENFSIEIKFPSDSFQIIFNNLLKLPKNTFTSFQIGVFISGIQKVDTSFMNNKEINFVKIDSNVSEISESSFENCISLSDFNMIKSSLESIKCDAFKGCLLLRSIKIPDSVKKIENNAFSSCFMLETVSFGADSFLIVIGDSSFRDCSSLIEITIPSSVVSIGNDAFKGCSSLSQISFDKPSSISSIGEGAFSDCSSLTEIDLPPIKVIHKGTFSRCLLLEQISIHSSLVEIGDSAFVECISLNKIKLPSSLNSIGSSAFENCGHLSELVFESNSAVKLIPSSSFADCSSLTRILIPSSVTKIEADAFKGCSSLEIVEFGENSKVKSIGENAFCGCSSLGKVAIPDSVIDIDPFAFKGCTSIVKISVSSSLKSFQKGVLENCSSLVEIMIPSSVELIETSAFEGCKSLKSISFKLPSSVRSIGDFAFCNCSSLNEISIPSSVTSIKQSAFNLCKSLKKLTISSSLEFNLDELDSNIIIEKI